MTDKNKKTVTIEELEHILNEPDGEVEVEILPNGEVRSKSTGLGALRAEVACLHKERDALQAKVAQLEPLLEGKVAALYREYLEVIVERGALEAKVVGLEERNTNLASAHRELEARNEQCPECAELIRTQAGIKCSEHQTWAAKVVDVKEPEEGKKNDG